MVYRGISISVYYVGLANITYTHYQIGIEHGAGLFQFFRTLGTTGVAVAIFTTLVNRYQLYYFEEFRNVTSYANFNIINELNMDNFSEKNLNDLYAQILKQAKIKSFNTDFFSIYITYFVFPFYII